MKRPGNEQTTTWPGWVKDLAFAVGIFALVFWLGQGMRGSGHELQASTPAPKFELQDIRSARKVMLEDLRGTPIALNFWGTWCGACRKELPELERLHRRGRGAYQVVTIAHDPPAKLARFVTRNTQLSLPILVDPPGAVHRAYGVTAVPTTVVIDARGDVVEVFTGASSTRAIGRRLEELAH